MSKVRKIVGGLVLAAAVAGGVLISSNTRGQEKKADEKAMMEAWQKGMTPGKAHEAMAKKVGSWKAEMIDYSMGEKKSEETAEIKMLMGGRYQEVKVKGNVMGMPFEGCSLTGFDNLRQVYVNTWIDNLGTGITTAEGKATDDMTIEMKGQMADPMSGKMMDFRNVEKTVDDDHFTLEMFFNMQGKEKKLMTVNYSRVK